MQELRVVGLDDDGTSVVCEGPAGRFRLPIDDTLKAAVSGELGRAGEGTQTELELGSDLSPRDIQARIRAGATVDEIVDLTGAPAHRIKRFAGPVLLERSRAAEMSQLAHPVRGDGPMQANLADVVRSALAERGHSDTTEWDAFKGADNRWVVRIGWSVGKSSNQAHFRFAPGAHGGTAMPVDDIARELLDPDARRALRSIERTVDEEPILEEPLRAVGDDSARGPQSAPEAPHAAQHGRKHPEMPSWEDVLLGVRSGKNG
ncbi:septation protein SepH [Tsukamurella sp. 1534]|uniref:septation protein SepH n=1 Tax=Tsukamurella sp. 1534 TaxID=1151061 RepID=UPI000594678A|nr:septation protein SepH [Tsukamurella sp. 1534]